MSDFQIFLLNFKNFVKNIFSGFFSFLISFFQKKQKVILEKQTFKSINYPHKRSVLFLHNGYYNFYYLAKALRKRGWDAVSASIEDPYSHNAMFYHGEDINLYDADPYLYEQKIKNFFEEAKYRFKFIHFYGAGSSSFFPKYFGKTFDNMPADFLELKSRGVKIGYSHSGCNDMVKQSTFREWSHGGCDRCVWQNNPNVCSDELNEAWGKKISLLADLICIETDPAIDFKGGRKIYGEPLTFAVDADFWLDNLKIPESFKYTKGSNDFFVYHSVGNYKLRTQAEMNFKGTEAVIEAVNRLQQEGYAVQLIFIDNVSSKDIRFIQSQCDIAVDQLNYGRYGANARELMMLGIPVIAKLDKTNSGTYPLSKCIEESPIINADRDSIYDVLKYYLNNKDELMVLKKRVREHALKWWSADQCSQRFEKVYDALMEGKSYDEIRSII